MNESKELLTQIRATLASGLDSAASFRLRVAEEYPEDERNRRSARQLSRLAAELRIDDAYDDTPALRKLLDLVTEYDLPLEGILPSDPSSGFDASKYRFHDAKESDDDYLNRLAEATAIARRSAILDAVPRDL